jgi:hypothetical protein
MARVWLGGHVDSLARCLPFHGQFPGSVDSPFPRVPYRLFLLIGTYGLAVGLYLYVWETGRPAAWPVRMFDQLFQRGLEQNPPGLAPHVSEFVSRPRPAGASSPAPFDRPKLAPCARHSLLGVLAFPIPAPPFSSRTTGSRSPPSCPAHPSPIPCHACMYSRSAQALHAARRLHLGARLTAQTPGRPRPACLQAQGRDG